MEDKDYAALNAYLLAAVTVMLLLQLVLIFVYGQDSMCASSASHFPVTENTLSAMTWPRSS